jgi:hypothetical protein
VLTFPSYADLDPSGGEGSALGVDQHFLVHLSEDGLFLLGEDVWRIGWPGGRVKGSTLEVEPVDQLMKT